MNKKGLLLAIGLLTLSSCAEAPIEVTDLNSAILRLQQVDNYQVTRKSEDGTILFDAIYHPNYFFEEVSNIGFIKRETSVYPIYYEDDQIINKEIRSYTDIYGKDNALYNFDDLDASKIKTGVNQLTTKVKTVAIPLLEISGYRQSKYMETLSVKLDLKNNDKSFIDIEFTFEKYQAGQAIGSQKEYVTVSNVNKIKNDKIEAFIDSNYVRPIDENLKTLRSYFQGDNFTEYRKDEKGDMLKVTYYHEKYYCDLFSDKAIASEPLLKGKQILNLEITEPNKKLDFFKTLDGTSLSPMIYDDVYIFYYDGTYDTPKDEVAIYTTSDPVRPGYARGCFDRPIKDIRSAWHYPKNLRMFDDLGIFNTLSDSVFETEDLPAMKEYVNDLGYKDFFDANGGPSKLRVSFQNDKDASKAIAVFQIYLKNAPQSYVEVSYGNFGNTHFKPFDDILTKIANTPDFK